MRIFARLVASHAAPVIVVSLVLAFVLGALGRMTQLVDALGEEELGTLAREGALHEAAWNLDLALRGAGRRCAAGEGARAQEEVVRRRSALDEQLAATPGASRGLRDSSLGYLSLTDRLLESGGVCSEAYVRADADRAELDARITTLWVERLAELHAAAREQEEQARAIGRSSLLGGVFVAVIGLLLALWMARRMAGEISAPLGEIGRIARRLARGDFGEPLRPEGPVEISELAQELEHMRVRLAELELLKQGFLASVSHEMRTPLSKIREALALLSDGACGALSERQARVVGIARTACEREIRLVTTLLDLSRLRAGTPLQRRGSASIDAALENAVREESSDARAKRVTIELTREGDVPGALLDEALVERAIANLLRNAVSVSRPGQRVRVHRWVEERDGHRAAKVRVRDEGPGVPIDVRDTLFEPFVTVAVASSPKSLGVGLGLALSREVARAHGGDLELEDAEGPGASFLLSIPLETRRSVAPPAPRDASFEPSAEPDGGALRRPSSEDDARAGGAREVRA